MSVPNSNSTVVAEMLDAAVELTSSTPPTPPTASSTTSVTWSSTTCGEAPG